jgi:hypothetical protein
MYSDIYSIELIVLLNFHIMLHYYNTYSFEKFDIDHFIKFLIQNYMRLTEIIRETQFNSSIEP